MDAPLPRQRNAMQTASSLDAAATPDRGGAESAAFDAKAISRWVECAQGGAASATAHEETLAELWRLAYDSAENRKELMRLNVGPPLIRILEEGDATARVRAAGALANLADDSAEVQEELMRLRAGPSLVKLLEGGTDEAKEQAAAALANLAYSSDELREELMELGVGPVLVALLKGGAASAKEFAVAALQNLAASNLAIQDEFMRLDAGPPLVKLLEDGTESIKERAAAALANLAINSVENGEALIKLHVGPPLAKLLETGTTTRVKEQATALIAILAIDSVENREKLTELCVGPQLLKIFADGTDRSREMAAAALESLGIQFLQDQTGKVVDHFQTEVGILAEEVARAASKLSILPGASPISVAHHFFHTGKYVRTERMEHPNQVIRKLLWVQCRCVQNEWDDTLERDLKFAEYDAKRFVDPAIVNLLMIITEKQMKCCHLRRYAARKNPLVFTLNVLFTWPSWTASKLNKEAQRIFDEQLAPLVGDRENDERGQAIWKVIFSSAWGEQNRRDWLNAEGEYVRSLLIGQKMRYQSMAEKCEADVQVSSQKMGFERRRK